MPHQLKDLSIPVLKEQPEGELFDKIIHPAVVISTANHTQYYFCCKCDGWIEGETYDRQVSNLGPLCGRRGSAKSCIRCGEEIAFTGIVS